MYGRALVEERQIPRRHAELAAYVRQEYGSGIGPGFLLAEAANGVARKPRKRRDARSTGVFRTLAKAMKAFVAGNGERREANDLNPTR